MADLSKEGQSSNRRSSILKRAFEELDFHLKKDEEEIKAYTKTKRVSFAEIHSIKEFVNTEIFDNPLHGAAADIANTSDLTLKSEQIDLGTENANWECSSIHGMVHSPIGYMESTRNNDRSFIVPFGETGSLNVSAIACTDDNVFISDHKLQSSEAFPISSPLPSSHILPGPPTSSNAKVTFNALHTMPPSEKDDVLTESCFEEKRNLYHSLHELNGNKTILFDHTSRGRDDVVSLQHQFFPGVGKMHLGNDVTDVHKMEQTVYFHDSDDDMHLASISLAGNMEDKADRLSAKCFIHNLHVPQFAQFSKFTGESDVCLQELMPKCVVNDSNDDMAMTLNMSVGMNIDQYRPNQPCPAYVPEVDSKSDNVPLSSSMSDESRRVPQSCDTITSPLTCEHRLSIIQEVSSAGLSDVAVFCSSGCEMSTTEEAPVVLPTIAQMCRYFQVVPHLAEGEHRLGQIRPRHGSQRCGTASSESSKVGSSRTAVIAANFMSIEESVSIAARALPASMTKSSHVLPLAAVPEPVVRHAESDLYSAGDQFVAISNSVGKHHEITLHSSSSFLQRKLFTTRDFPPTSVSLNRTVYINSSNRTIHETESDSNAAMILTGVIPSPTLSHEVMDLDPNRYQHCVQNAAVLHPEETMILDVNETGSRMSLTCHNFENTFEAVCSTDGAASEIPLSVTISTDDRQSCYILPECSAELFGSSHGVHGGTDAQFGQAKFGKTVSSENKLYHNASQQLKDICKSVTLYASEIATCTDSRMNETYPIYVSSCTTDGLAVRKATTSAVFASHNVMEGHGCHHFSHEVLQSSSCGLTMSKDMDHSGGNLLKPSSDTCMKSFKDNALSQNVQRPINDVLAGDHKLVCDALFRVDSNLVLSNASGCATGRGIVACVDAPGNEISESCALVSTSGHGFEAFVSNCAFPCEVLENERKMVSSLCFDGDPSAPECGKMHSADKQVPPHKENPITQMPLVDYVALASACQLVSLEPSMSVTDNYVNSELASISQKKPVMEIMPTHEENSSSECHTNLPPPFTQTELLITTGSDVSGVNVPGHEAEAGAVSIDADSPYAEDALCETCHLEPERKILQSSGNSVAVVEEVPTVLIQNSGGCETNGPTPSEMTRLDRDGHEPHCTLGSVVDHIPYAVSFANGDAGRLNDTTNQEPMSELSALKGCNAVLIEKRTVGELHLGSDFASQLNDGIFGENTSLLLSSSLCFPVQVKSSVSFGVELVSSLPTNLFHGMDSTVVTDTQGERVTYLAGSFLSTCRQLGIAEFELNGGLARLNTLSDKPHFPCNSIKDHLYIANVVEKEVLLNEDFMKNLSEIIERDKQLIADLEQDVLHRIHQQNLIEKTHGSQEIRSLVQNLFGACKNKTRSLWISLRIESLMSFADDLKVGCTSVNVCVFVQRKNDGIKGDILDMAVTRQEALDYKRRLKLCIDKLNQELVTLHAAASDLIVRSRHREQQQHLNLLTPRLSAVQEKVSESKRHSEKLAQTVRDLQSEKVNTEKQIDRQKGRQEELAGLHHTVTALFSVHCWRPMHIDQQRMSFLLLYDSVRLDVLMCGDSSTQQSVASIAVRSLLKDQSMPWAKLTAQLTVDTLSADRDRLIRTYPTRSHIRQMLRDITAIVEDQRELCHEVKLACLHYLVSISGKRVTVVLWNEDKIRKVSLSTDLSTSRYPSQALHWTANVILGCVSENTVLSAMDKVGKGRQQFTTSLGAVNKLLSQ